MTYPFIPIGLIAVFAVYIIYLLVTRNTAKLKTILPLGLTFIAVWAVIYYLLLR